MARELGVIGRYARPRRGAGRLPSLARRADRAAPTRTRRTGSRRGDSHRRAAGAPLGFMLPYSLPRRLLLADWDTHAA